jgi:hypothetical protein
MVDTATALRDISDRTIILTGAVQPRSMRHSDIAINGQVLDAMRFDLKRRFGIRDDASDQVGAQFELRGDNGQQLFKESQKVDVSVEGMLRITLAVKAVSQSRGYAGWGDARLTSPTPLAC